MESTDVRSQLVDALRLAFVRPMRLEGPKSRTPNPVGATVSAGPTTSATKSSPASSNSTNNATRKYSSTVKPILEM